jgi:xylan 1,4-beta-xylosidase
MGMLPVICNPLDLAYRFQDVRAPSDARMRMVFREAADPSIVRFKGRYFMFVSMSRGFWHSTDLVSWEYVPTDKLPALDYAPDVREVDGALYITASRRGRVCPFYRSENPLDDDFVEVTPGTFEFWDPNLFQDDDGQTYFYWGCASDAPIYGSRIDSRTFELHGETRELVFSDEEHRGWEQNGENHIKGRKFFLGRDITDVVGHDPFIEGAWMTKRDGTYYLQYAAPATEFNTYADGYLTAADPLGPFEYSLHSPFSSKPGGFITGAGHGSTFQDEWGNWWHAATMRISVNHDFERRVGIFPAGFDDDGVLFCNQNFGDYPLRMPQGPIDPWRDVSTGWMLLSYRSDVLASSQSAGHPATLAVDEDVRTWWVASAAEHGEWFQVDLGSVQTVHAIQVNLADHDLSNRAPLLQDGAVLSHLFRGIDPHSHPTGLLVETSPDGRTWQSVADTRSSGTEQPHAFFVLDEPASARFVRVTAGAMPFDAPFAMSALRVFGHAGGALPAQTRVRTSRRDSRTVFLDWDGVQDAQGYNVRFGTAPDKLYHSWLVYEQTELTVPSLNAGVPYWFTVDSFNASGVTAGSPATRA